MDADALRSMLDASQQAKGIDAKFTPEESNRFKKAFDDPEFRKMFSEYMDELQDPQHREETEAYISQLEGEQKIPEGKELIRYCCDNLCVLPSFTDSFTDVPLSQTHAGIRRKNTQNQRRRQRSQGENVSQYRTVR